MTTMVGIIKNKGKRCDFDIKLGEEVSGTTVRYQVAMK